MQQFELEKLKKNLPKNPGILGKEEYFNSAVLIPLILVDGEYNFLFEKRAAEIRQGGEICFPGGQFDLDRDSGYQDTAVRETVEELGIDEKIISIVGQIDTLIGPMGVTVDSFVAQLIIEDITKLKVDPGEVEKIFLLPVSLFQKNGPDIYRLHMEVHPYYFDKSGERIDLFPAEELALPSRYRQPWKAKKHKVLVYKTDHGTIWGITAKLIFEVLKRLSD